MFTYLPFLPTRRWYIYPTLDLVYTDPTWETNLAVSPEIALLIHHLKRNIIDSAISLFSDSTVYRMIASDAMECAIFTALQNTWRPSQLQTRMIFQCRYSKFTPN